MLLKHYRQELTYDECDYYYYVITNGAETSCGSLAVSGREEEEGLNIQFSS